MKYTTLPGTDIRVSKICLGSMTWGEQNTEEEGHQQLDYAIDQGVNFVDTAELYSVPANKDTQGSTERIIGTWLKKTGKRDEVVIATKIVGPRDFVNHIRTGGFTKEEFTDAINKSLQRLQTDYIDLYQLHWPERNANFFGVRGYTHDESERWNDNFGEVLNYLQGFIAEGKIRQIGLSNETPYGVMRYTEEARKGVPKMITVQNPYNLLNRKDEVGLTEVLHRENIGHLPYSPLGFGQLTGKYLDETPKNARVTLFPQFARYHNEKSFEATRAYNEIAKKHGISLAQMALAFINDRPFVTSNIIGATSLDQLKENIGSIDITLSDTILKEIETVHENNPNPAP
ncbi:aryl-alcohol dehydrogenase-like predicted oxidoreductase [Aquimarina sp. MAR_2010_214]|uniref:aldo/keto reductase n=1 Tax=Aquimarina sp. MAR_2010_214 TaxID=1250026 RepID=UPI000C701464|nr:aldo/keto reductase [Aquimarina sp. MAR_2010_214]PKV48480.1 aryl-alcohol dehydrogenase-like predicted oxidoreductase [Aquimarina sp. MAR_2010_214]